MDKPSCRMLGINLKNNLSWEAHLVSGKAAVLPAVRQRIGMLSRVCTNMLMNSLAISKLAYLICMWGNTATNYLKQAQTVLNLAARVVTRAPKRTRQRDLMLRCKWLDVTEMSMYYSLMQLWKSVCWNIPEYLQDKISLEEEDEIVTSFPHLQLTAGSFQFKTVDISPPISNLRYPLPSSKLESEGGFSTAGSMMMTWI